MDSLGDRMKKNYENRYRFYLTRRTPAILRLDGKSFHTLTKNCRKPFDYAFIRSMLIAATKLLGEIQGAKAAYIQSDEISILLTDYDRFETEAWFDYNIQKMTSIAASICSLTFSNCFFKNGVFDCRAFNIPREEVRNYFIWRQKDWERNSLNMYCESFFTHKELEGKNTVDRHEMLHEIGKNWSSIDPLLKNGTFLKTQEDPIEGKIIKQYNEIRFALEPTCFDNLLKPEEE